MIVLIDDYIPCIRKNPCFSSANGNELWVTILEKAWAKAHGCYSRIIAGQCHQTFRDMTGAPAWEFMSSPDDGDEDDVWEKIKEGDKNNFIMSAGVSGEDPAEAGGLEKLGLVGGHAYGLLAVAEVKDRKGKLTKIVQLRNPWGSFEWKGDWGDDSDIWTS